MSMRAYGAAFRFGLQQARRDKAELVGSFTTYALLLCIFSSVYAIMPIYELGVPHLTPAHLLWYFAVAECVIMGCPGLATFGREIADGKLTEFLQRPTHVPAFVLARLVGFHTLLSLMLLLFAAVVLPLVFAAPSPMPLVHLPLFLLSLWLGLVLMELMGYVLSTLEIVGPYSKPMSWIVGKFVFAFGGLFFPVSFFPPLLRDVAMLTPFPAVIFMPGQFMLTNDLAVLLQGMAQQIFWLFALWGLVLFTNARMTQRVLQQGE